MKASTILLGNLDIDELVELIIGKKTLFEFRMEKLFKDLDKNNSNDLDENEIKDHFKKSMGDEYSDEYFNDSMK